MNLGFVQKYSLPNAMFEGNKIYYTANKDVLTSYLCMYCGKEGISITKSEFPMFEALALLFAFLLQQIKTTA